MSSNGPLSTRAGSLFSLSDLRNKAIRESPASDAVTLPAEQLLALVEAVEAARTLRSFERTFEPEHRGLPDIKTRLDSKLEAFGEL